ncbi:energy transducer TonB [Psychroserpens sp.]|uniref:energy transducer TonB n=1 Tax=Psychroserpens sp. TaxID=2020870 RepID=UPI00385E998E
MLHYILQVVAFQLVFLIIYDVFLRKETFFNWNRAYLLGTGILSVLIPFIKIDSIKEIVPEAYVIRLPEVIIGNVTQTNPIHPEIANLAGISIQPETLPLWNIIMFSGMCIATLILVYKISKLLLLASKHPKRWRDNLLIIKLIDSTAAFSFFNYVFLGENISTKDRSSILEHEMIHVKQKHTLDLLFFEVFRIVFWFNPLVYMYQNRIATLHEYIADAKAVKRQNKTEYYNNLLAQVFETQQFSFVNPFFKQSLIKKRIIMLSKTKSKQINILKYALLLPMVCTMLVYTSSYAQEKNEVIEETIQLDDSKFSDEELKTKFYNQIKELNNNEGSFLEISSFVKSARDKYVLNRVEYYKIAAFFDLMNRVSEKKETKSGALTEADITRHQRLNSIYNRTYAEYLEWKQTDEAKEIWENNTRDGVLRLLVQDASNMTDEEEQKMNHKLDMIERDDYFKKLLIVSIDGSSKMLLQDPKSPTVISEEIVIEEVEETVEVPFAIVDQVPVMVSCQHLTTNEELKACMSKNIASHVSKNFNTDLAKQIGLVGKQRISVIFKIDTDGNVTGVKARAPHPGLEEEAIRVVKLLPQFKPGKQKGKAVTVPYSLPILFQVKGDTKPVQEVVEIQDTKKPLSEIPYSIVEVAPVFKSCNDLNNENERKTCTSNKVASFVNKNFNLKLATALNLIGVQKIWVAFKIDKNGDVIDVKARAPHPELEKEAIRVIKLLPQFIPGKQKGKVVVVPYSLPISFKVANDKKEDKKN